MPETCETKWDIDKFPVHMKVDAQTRNDNIDLGHDLCKRCEGTGNELYSMYRKCKDCNGSGEWEQKNE